MPHIIADVVSVESDANNSSGNFSGFRFMLGRSCSASHLGHFYFLLGNLKLNSVEEMSQYDTLLKQTIMIGIDFTLMASECLDVWRFGPYHHF